MGSNYALDTKTTLKPPCCDTYYASDSFTEMSFCSAWSHAAKPSPLSSPSLPHIAPQKPGDSTPPSVSGGQSEPILVVTNLRPSSRHDLKMDKSVKQPVEAVTKPQPPPETVLQVDANAVMILQQVLIKPRIRRLKQRRLRMGVGLLGGYPKSLFDNSY